MKKNKNMHIALVLSVGAIVFSLAGCALTTTDATPPSVDSTSPGDSTLSAALYGTVDVTFSEAMDPTTMVPANFIVAKAALPVAGTVDYDDSNNTAIFTPLVPLDSSTTYTATITKGAKNAAGKALATNKLWHFTTSPTVDTTPPTILNIFPAGAAMNVDVNSTITATFSEPMTPSTIVAANFTLKSGAASVPGKVSYDVATMSASYDPTGSLAPNTIYTATITTGVKDRAGNALAIKIWTFTTIPAAGLGPVPVTLGTAGNFAILAKTGISTVPPSVISGNIGVSPVAESYMTGFSQTNATGYALSTQVKGFMYAANMAPPTPAKMTTAISDMETAYNDAAGRRQGAGATNLNVGAGTLSAKTFIAGTYTWKSGVNIAGDITISGAANDVWLFQISGTLTESNGMHVILANGAQAKNIFWQVAGAVTLGTTAHFEGNILGKTGITLQTNASMNGRALAQTLVALQKATVTKP